MDKSVVLKNLKMARKRAGYNQTNFAAECGWVQKNGDPAQSTVSMCEAGERPLDIEDVLLWAKVCGVAPAELFSGVAAVKETNTNKLANEFGNFPPELRAALADLASPGNAKLRKFFADIYWAAKSLYEKDMLGIEADLNMQMLPPPSSKGGIDL